MEVDFRPETVGIYWNNILTEVSIRKLEEKESLSDRLQKNGNFLSILIVKYSYHIKIHGLLLLLLGAGLA